jgi:hypothetical protein
MPAGGGECGARGRSLISFALGRPGHQACRHYRPAREVLTGLGQAKTGNARSDRVPGSMAWVAPKVT